jgi:alpha-L-fucosidase
MNHNSESIYGTTYGPIQGVSSVRTTAKGRDVFVHIFDWPSATIDLVATGLPKFASASLLATGSPIEFNQHDRGVALKVPAQAPDPDVTVIVMKGT